MTDAARAFFHPPASLVLGAVALMASTAAVAADPAKFTVKDGLVQFENVRVIDVANSGLAPTTSSTAAHLRAYVTDDGTLRQPTPEENAANSGTASQVANPVMQSMVRTTGKRVFLDESQMLYSVVKRNADGSIVEVCQPGEEAAHKAADVAASVQGETR